MNIRDFSHNLQKLYEEISESFSRFQKESELPCLPSCGRCCLNPEVEASVSEMIPMALFIFDEGKAEEWMMKLQLASHKSCQVFIPGPNEGEGKCGRYEQRPGVCRMFGVAGAYDKNKKRTLSICKYIKSTYPTERTSLEHIEKKTSTAAPILSEWAMKIQSLDPTPIQSRLPINEALLLALEKVSLTLSYDKEN